MQAQAFGRSDAGLDRPFLSPFRPPDRSPYLALPRWSPRGAAAGDRQRFLRFDPIEHLLATSLAAATPGISPRCANGRAMGLRRGPTNVGALRAGQSGAFGVCLMAEADRHRTA